MNRLRFSLLKFVRVHATYNVLTSHFDIGNTGLIDHKHVVALVNFIAGHSSDAEQNHQGHIVGRDILVDLVDSDISVKVHALALFAWQSELRINNHKNYLAIDSSSSMAG